MLNPRFQTRKHRIFRTLVFSLTGLSGFAPLIHGCVYFGFSLMMKQTGAPYYIAQLFFLAGAGLVYAVSLLKSLLELVLMFLSTEQISRESVARKVRHIRLLSSVHALSSALRRGMPYNWDITSIRLWTYASKMRFHVSWLEYSSRLPPHGRRSH
jgi:hypothetical protein